MKNGARDCPWDHEPSTGGQKRAIIALARHQYWKLRFSNGLFNIYLESVTSDTLASTLEAILLGRFGPSIFSLMGNSGRFLAPELEEVALGFFGTSYSD